MEVPLSEILHLELLSRLLPSRLLLSTQHFTVCTFREALSLDRLLQLQQPSLHIDKKHTTSLFVSRNQIGFGILGNRLDS